MLRDTNLKSFAVISTTGAPWKFNMILSSVLDVIIWFLRDVWRPKNGYDIYFNVANGTGGCSLGCFFTETEICGWLEERTLSTWMRSPHLSGPLCIIGVGNRDFWCDNGFHTVCGYISVCYHTWTVAWLIWSWSTCDTKYNLVIYGNIPIDVWAISIVGHGNVQMARIRSSGGRFSSGWWHLIRKWIDIQVCLQEISGGQQFEVKASYLSHGGKEG